MEWIKVSDMMPPMNTTLAIIADGVLEKSMKIRFTMIGYWSETKGWELTGENYLSLWVLTPIYWTSLPTYPEEPKVEDIL